MNRLPVTVTIITLNEERHLRRTLESVRWAEEVLVVDSGSTDRTAEIARAAGAKVIVNPWPGYGQQKNFAQDHARYDWILNLDGDEALSPELSAEIQKALSELAPETRGFSMPRKTYYLGRWIAHGGWYPNELVRLADRRHARWSEPQVHEALEVRGTVQKLRSPIEHDAFQSVADQVRTNLNFARLGAEELKRRGKRPSLVLILFKPLGKFIETYLLKRGFLDGLRGLVIALNAAHSMFMKQTFLWELEWRDAHSRDRQ